jgi:streptogramin lyase
MSVSAESRVGTELLGYRIEALLGRGGMGVVYKAYDPHLKRNVALKLIAPELSGDVPFRDRFLIETELAASLEHPNVVPIHDAGEVDGQLYIAMRYVEGTDLKQLLQAERVLDPERAVTICAQVGAALDAAHARSLVHRDVKPSNVLLDGNEHVYLADFGLSRRLADPGVPGAGSFSVGTPAYAAPEQIEGGDVDGRADVYSLGCVVYECLSGEVPFKRDSDLGVLWAHVQEEPPVLPGLEEVMPTALAKDPDERYATCGELVVAAQEALGLNRPVTIRDRKALIFVAVGVALAAAAVIAGVLISQGGGPGKPSTKPTLTPKVDSVQRIDPKTNKLVHTIGGAGSNPTAMAAGSGGVWVGSIDDGTVSEVDPRRDVVRALAVKSAGPAAIAIDDGGVLVANQDRTIATIDPTTLKVTTKALDAKALAVRWGAVWALHPVPTGMSVVRINQAGDVVTTVTAVGFNSFALAAGEGGVWIVDDISRTVFRVDPATNRVTARIRLRFDPGGIAAGGGSVWVTNPSGDAVVRIDPSRNKVVGSTPVQRGPVAIAFGDRAVWVANYLDRSVSRIDPRTGVEVARIPVGPYPGVIAAGEGGVWVAVRAA